MSEKGGGIVKLDYIKIKVGSGGIMQGGNQSNFSKNIKRRGCGMIAACDMLLYKQGRKDISDSEYKQFVNDNSNSFFYKMHYNLIGVAAYRVVKFLRKQGYNFRFVPWYRLKGERFRQLVSETLEKDTPVIVRVGLNGKKLPYKVLYTVNGRTSQGMMSWHYITVTGMENDTLTYSSWGATGEVKVADLQKNLGFMGGIIIPKSTDRSDKK